MHSENAVQQLDEHAASEVAVIGFAGRFPGAQNVDEFWRNLRDGVESISFFTKEEMLASGVEPELVDAPDYVPAKAIVENIDLFDAAFFDFSPREAEMLDPQHRVLLECAVEAFEHAGYYPENFKGRVGVYTGVSAGSYLNANLSSHADLIERVGAYQVDIGNHGEFVPTTISFKLNLKGPSINVQTACSTSLVAVHVACQSLLNGECDMALAGGGSITFPHKEGYVYREEGILSPDGHCRTFDSEARGTVAGEGAALVVLKRLVDAIADGDTIHAVIKGSAVNNDGSLKIGYTAPSVDGQADVIAEALAMAGVSAETINYIEAHGTGTALGDPVEIAALTQAFGVDPEMKNFCAIGSVKTNIGHLDAAAGIAGLIKTILALKHAQIPASLHYKQPNPKIDFAGSPFIVNDKLVHWKRGETPRRAGVSSFGIGGTNVHVVVEEPPPVESTTTPARRQQLLLLSAKSAAALDAATANLAEFLKHNRDVDLADVAYTLQLGRGGYSHRRFLVCKDHDDALTALETRDPARLLTLSHEPKHRPVVFMFPGQGTQYVGMGRQLYETEPVFREYIDLCAEQLAAHLHLDLRDVLYPNADGEDEANRLLGQTFITQPALFCIEYALAQLWMSWGVAPSAMIGHSIGEYVAACLAGVFSLEDALALVAARGRLMQDLPPGAMLAVMLSETETRSLLRNGLSLAAVNGAKNCVVSGTSAAIQSLHDQLKQQDIYSQVLHTSHAFHSAMMEPILEAFTDRVRQVRLNAPAIPFLSNVTGAWQNRVQVTDPTHWSHHLRQTVRFADGLGNLLQDADKILVEVGPGQTLSALVRQHSAQKLSPLVVSSLPRPRDGVADSEFLLTNAGKFWLAGGRIDWAGFHAGEQRRRVPLPSYPFERQRYYLEPITGHTADRRKRTSSAKRADVADWFYLPSWKQFDLPRLTTQQQPPEHRSSLIFCDESGAGETLAQRLRQSGEDVVVVHAGDQLERTSDRAYTLNPASKKDYDALVNELVTRGLTFTRVIHLWSLDDAESFERAQQTGLYSLLFLTQALADRSLTNSLQFVVVTNGVQEVNGDEALRPDRATVLGACKVIPQEYPEIICRSIDVTRGAPQLVDQLANELTNKGVERVVAYRGRHRWVQSFEPLRLEQGITAQSLLEEGGVYLITGGLGEVGFALAQHLARNHKAKLALLGRSRMPQRAEWDQWLHEHEPGDPVSNRIRKVRDLEAAGAEVLLLNADAANEEQMLAALNQTAECFGRIDGVIYGAAAAAGTEREIRETAPADCMVQFQAKVHGLPVLEKVLQGRDYKFCLMLSSLSSVLGGMGFAAYAGANIYMDTFVRQHNQRGGKTWLSVNWDAWNDAAVDPQRGGEALERVLSLGPVPQIVVSVSDLDARLDRWVSFEDSRAAVTVEKTETSVLHPRPSLPTAYVAPSNELEQDLADTWRELLGIEQVGVKDNFFELGGHSLLATMLMSRLRKEFGVELSLRSFFESPTVSGLALIIAERVIEDSGHLIHGFS